MASQIIKLSEKDKWESFIEKLPLETRDVYFTPQYYSLYQNNGDGEAQCFVFEKDGELALFPFLKNPITSLGYELEREFYDIQGAYGYNGIISSTDSEDFIAAFWEEFDRWCQDNDIVAEFMRFHPILNNHLLASPQMKTFFSRHTVALDLTDDDIWMQQISSKNRNMIRKAEKEGVSIVESNDFETFRQLYNGTMSDLHAEAFYFFPQKYYEDYKKEFVGRSLLCFATLDGQVIAGSMIMLNDNYAHYHLSARNREYSRYAANNLILWYCIQKAKERGCKWFHFGGGTTGDDDDSLLKFKKQFSKKTCEFWIGKRVHNQPIYSQIVEQWKTKHPDSYEAHKVMLLGYREI